jgi:hypothetical protein
MPTRNARHTFTGGMVKDLGVHLTKPDTYLHAENLRYLATEKSLTGLLYTPTSSSALDADIDTAEDEIIMGHCLIRDYLFLFTIDNDGFTYIRRVTVTATGLAGSANNKLIWQSDGTSADAAFSSTEYLSCVGRYESDTIYKIYWASKGYPIRCINGYYYQTENPNRPVNPGVNDFLPVTRFDLITTFDTTVNSTSYSTGAIELMEVTSGGLESGRIQYAYSLIKKNGQETVPCTLLNSPINIYSSNTNVTPSAMIKGDYEIKNSNKGVKLLLNVGEDDRTYFDKIRLYRVHYKSYGQEPEVIIVNDYGINTTQDEQYIIDGGGVGLGVITPDEFSVFSNIQYEAYTIEEKDNRLFAANVVEETFDVDYDCRAYRFNSVADGQLARLYENYTDNTGLVIIDGTDSSPDYDVDEEHNCVNKSNDIDNDSSASIQYWYQSDGATVGGEGLNIKYSFIYDKNILDVNPITGDNILTYGAESDTYGFTDYSNPYIVNSLTGYQRDEIYRMGIVFINTKGQRSPAKWIGDIRFPSPTLLGVADNFFSYSSPNVHYKALGISVSIKTALPTGVLGWELVRMKRTNEDKTVLGAGAVFATNDRGTYTCKRTRPEVYDTGITDENLQLISFINPENIFNKSTRFAVGDRLDIQGVYQQPGTAADNNEDCALYIKYYDYASLSASTDTFYTIDDNEFILPRYANGDYTFSFSAADGLEYRGWGLDDTGGTGQTSHGRCDTIQLTGAISTSFFTDAHNEMAYAYVKRPNLTKYGGYTYADRQLNEYISCGQPRIDDATPASKSFFGGDTYINYFDYLNTMCGDEVQGTGTLSIFSNVIFPIESTINLCLRHDECISKNYTSHVTIDADFHQGLELMREEAGLYYSKEDSSTHYYTQETDYYLYNTIYSQEQNINLDSSLDISDNETDFDTRIIWSDYKLDNTYFDSWCKFRVGNTLDVTGLYGPIYSINKLNNNLYFFQERAVGYLPVNQRSLIQDNNPGILALGTANVLDRYDYLNLYCGVQNKKSICSSKEAIWFVDKDNKAMFKFTGNQLVDLGLIKGMKSYFRDTTSTTVPFLVSNNKDNELYIKYSNDDVILFNTATDNFISFYTYTPIYMLDAYVHTMYQTDTYFLYGLYLDTTSYTKFDNYFYDALITLVDGSDYEYTKVYDNIRLNTNVIEDSTKNTYEQTFNYITCSNDYQHTGEIALILGDNLERREREFTLAIPRNVVEVNETGNVDVTLVANQDSTRLYKERMRDKYLKTTFRLNSNLTANLDKVLELYYIIFNYRISIR